MAITQTERLERETEQTRAQVEHTLAELRARMSPAQLLDQATDYLRNGNGRVFASNLRDQVVDNPLPVSLIGAGIAWLAISGTISRRTNGDGRGRSTVARNNTRNSTGQDRTDGGEDFARGGDDAGHRARYAAEEWVEEAGSTASEPGATVREATHELGERIAGAYERTMHGTRRVANKAAEYGRAARHAVEPDGTLIALCREQPMLVAGIGLAIGAALGALLPISRPEERIMGEASRDLKNQVRDAANGALQAVAKDGTARNQASETAASHVERNMEQGTKAPNIETEPHRAAPHDEAASGAVTASKAISENGARSS